MNILDKLNRFEALIRSSEYMEYAHRLGAEYDDTCAKIAAARAEILSAFKQSNTSVYVETETAWDQIVTDACEEVDGMLDDNQFDYYNGVTLVSDLPELRDIIETAIIRATVANATTEGR